MLLKRLFAYQVIDLICVTSEVLVHQVERIPSEEYGLVKGLCLPVGRECLVHKVSNVELHSRGEAFFLHPWAAIASESELFAADCFKFVHNL